ncbi:MAG: DUF4386 domain-containing protein [Gammaproteobacteria bacterium]|nr:DUF4386 domain-containing protein [Gammaproteobacteria bacterium]
MTHRSVARIVGILFIVATVSFSLSVIILEPVLSAPNLLALVSRVQGQVSVGILLELVNHIAIVSISVLIYPVLKPFSERLALGYVVARSIEAVLFAIATMHLLDLIDLSHEFVAAGSPSPSYFHTLGNALLAGHDWNSAPFAFIAFSLGSLILNYALYQTRLVPRWISVFGLLAAASILTARLMLLYGLELSSNTMAILDGPIFLQEMIFAVWLIFKGFDRSVLPAEAIPANK